MCIFDHDYNWFYFTQEIQEREVASLNEIEDKIKNHVSDKLEESVHSLTTSLEASIDNIEKILERTKNNTNTAIIEHKLQEVIHRLNALESRLPV